jgi:hypothetical protein
MWWIPYMDPCPPPIPLHVRGTWWRWFSHRVGREARRWDKAGGRKTRRLTDKDQSCIMDTTSFRGNSHTHLIFLIRVQTPSRMEWGQLNPKSLFHVHSTWCRVSNHTTTISTSSRPRPLAPPTLITSRLTPNLHPIIVRIHILQWVEFPHHLRSTPFFPPRLPPTLTTPIPR